MRFAEPAFRCTARFAPLLLAVALGGLTGCASLNNIAWPWKLPTPAQEASADTPSAVPTAVPTAAPVKAAPAPEPVVAPVVVVEPAPAGPTLAERAAAILKSESDVAPAVQRSFDQ